MLLATEPMCAVSQTGGASASSRACGGAAGWRPPTERQLAAWVCERAQQLDGSTGARLWRVLSRCFPAFMETCIHVLPPSCQAQVASAARLAVASCPLPSPAGQLPNALALLEAGAAALHYGQPSIGALLALGQELLPLIKLGAPAPCPPQACS